MPAEWEFSSHSIEVCSVSIISYVGGGRAGKTDHRVDVQTVKLLGYVRPVGSEKLSFALLVCKVKF